VTSPAASSHELVSGKKSSEESIARKRSGQESMASKRSDRESVVPSKQTSLASVSSKRSSKKCSSTKLHQPSTVVTEKSTEAHRICVCARDEAYEVYSIICIRFLYRRMGHVKDLKTMINARWSLHMAFFVEK